MRRNLALCLLLGLGILIVDCVPQLALTTPAPDMGVHLLVKATGDLSHKRPGWEKYLPLSFGTALDRDDLLRAGSDAEGLIVCADLSLAEMPPGYHGGLPCPQAEPILRRGENLVVGPQRDAAMLSSIPYVLSPRHTFIQTEHPLLRWYPYATEAITYTVQVWGQDLDWQTETIATELCYPNDAPLLKPNKSYHLTVTDNEGCSSKEEQTALDLSFALLPSERVGIVQALVAQAQDLGLDDPAVRLLEAEIYVAYGLRADAIAVLEKLTTEEEAPAVQRRLGDLYLEVGLYTEARTAYERALAGYRTLGDQVGEAATLTGLGLAYWGNEDDGTAQHRLEQARDLYEALGDAEGVERVKGTLGKMGGGQ